MVSVDVKHHVYLLTHCVQTGLQAVECEDGSGQVLRLLEGDGLLLSRNISPDILDRVDNFRARKDDVLLASYPKCGTVLN